MPAPLYIRKVAVLGAGVMGTQIAAQLINAGKQCKLYDLASKEGNRDALIDKAIAHAKKLKPAPFATEKMAELIQACNYEDDLAKLTECDLIIEAIAERMDWKLALYEKIIPFISDNAILATNTSGLSINALSNILPKNVKPRFCGMHFFNPPRYMHLAELIPTQDTSKDLLNYLETWLTSTMGKGVVRAKDTPNFIANRVGVFSLLVTIYHADSLQLGLDEVDALTGPLLGRPKSATFRTMDVVGLDTMRHVVNTMQEQLQSDPWHSLYNLPIWLNDLIEKGHIGQKVGQGIYRKAGKIIEVFDPNAMAYRPANSTVCEEVKNIMKERNIQKRMQALMNCAHKQAKFIVNCYRDLFHYCAYHLQEIAESVRDVDLALRWGFGWQQGPFESWQLMGFDEFINEIRKALNERTALAEVELPEWLSRIQQFYNEGGAFSPSRMGFVPRSELPVYKKQYFPERVLAEKTTAFETLYENEGVNLSRFKEGTSILSFKTKANTVGQSVLDGINAAMDVAEKESTAVIIYQHDAATFSAGADLRGVAVLIANGKFNELETMIKQFQQTCLRLKYSSLPIVAALRGKALGGGCELLLHCDAIVAAFESYPGLVEVGVGLIPAGGGCKEMAFRAAHQTAQGDLLVILSKYFEQIATAAVANSALDAQQKAYLRSSDYWLMNNHEVLYAALARSKAMLDANYQPPNPAERIRVAGREGFARLRAGLVNWKEGQFITEHDYHIAESLANVLCAGDLNEGTLVDESWILKLEREAFLSLAANPLTQARITHLLETSKPLRN